MVPFLGFLKKKKDENFIASSINKQNNIDIISLSLSDVYSEINLIEEQNLKDIAKKITPFTETYNDTLKNLQSILNQLEKEKIHVEDSRFQSLVEKSKKTVVESLKKEISFDKYEFHTIDDVISFKNKLSNMIKKFEDLSKSHRKIFNFFIQKHTGKLQSEIDTISGIYHKIDLHLQDYNLKNSSYSQIRRLLSEIKSIRSSIDSMEKDIDKKNSDILNTEKQLKEIETKIQIIKNSNEYSQLMIIDEKINSLNIEIGKFHQQLLNNFGQIKRAMVKYSYGLNQNDLSMIQRMLNFPWEIFLDNDFSLYLNHLIRLQKELQTKRISLKDSEKTEFYLDKIIDSIYEHKKLEEAFHSRLLSLFDEKSKLNTGRIESLEKEKNDYLLILEKDKTILQELSDKFTTDNENHKRLKIDFEKKFQYQFGQNCSLKN
ncbi:MAG: hypothetical protein DA328_03940 [Nitrososphaeraceae archaeon]|nr:hypothetical protein [Nitrososphaeraceae archaeon]